MSRKGRETWGTLRLVIRAIYLLFEITKFTALT
jgi:hypothetical protein